ncbi:hypothetical protein [Tateyamaria pelophila]|uniref:hypothetical protein n=1 Tax=Tateyamaria pelophila TaxID=328415 RepID=UPI001CBB7891|nr:hypothetical protein [Tateyamaria pelophila]
MIISMLCAWLSASSCLPGEIAENMANCVLKQVGTDVTVTLGFVRRDGPWYTDTELLAGDLKRLISVPNAPFLDLQLEDYARRDRFLFKTVLGLRYETTPDQSRYIWQSCASCSLPIAKW